MTVALQPLVPARVLVVDDEPSARLALTELLRDEGYDVQSAGDGFKALGRVGEWIPDVVITDVKMPGMDGIELMGKMRERVPDVGFIVMTAFSSVEDAVEAMRRGSDDYLTKPIQLPHLLLVLQRVLEHRALRREAERLRGMLGEGDKASKAGLIGKSRTFRDLVDLIEQVAPSDVCALLLGESGTGKEQVARVLHQWSRRADAPFVVMRCGALSEDLIVAELFGVEGGNGAGGPRIGRLEQANGGTLLLEEVAALSPAVQIKILQFLQQRSFERIGGERPIAVDVRILASTKADLHQMMAAGDFREDLFYRLNVVTVRLPSLRERAEDIPLLATFFLSRQAKAAGKRISGFTDRALGVLMSHDWPGNVRQLENAVERAVVLARDGEIEPRHLPRDLMSQGRAIDEMPRVPGASLRELEKFAILKTLESVGGSTSKAARVLGISPRKIQYRLNEYKDNEGSGLPAVVAADLHRRTGTITEAESEH